jgi:hypothetical protein
MVLRLLLYYWGGCPNYGGLHMVLTHFCCVGWVVGMKNFCPLNSADRQILFLSHIIWLQFNFHIYIKFKLSWKWWQTNVGIGILFSQLGVGMCTKRAFWVWCEIFAIPKVFVRLSRCSQYHHIFIPICLA